MATPLNRRLARLILGARAAIAWERLWPALAPMAGVLVVFVASAWMGLWVGLSPTVKLVLLGLFLLAFVAAGWRLARLTMPARGRLRYQVEFTTNENEPHRFDGERKLSLKGLPVALTVLRGQITSGDGKSVGRALLRFDLRNELPRFLRSIEYRP